MTNGRTPPARLRPAHRQPDRHKHGGKHGGKSTGSTGQQTAGPVLVWVRELRPIILRAMWLGVLVWLTVKGYAPAAIGELVKAIRSAP